MTLQDVEVFVQDTTATTQVPKQKHDIGLVTNGEQEQRWITKMSRYRLTMKDALREVRGLTEDATTSYPPKEINKKKHAAYKDPKKGEREIITKEADDPTVDDIAKGLKLDKKLVKKIMGEVFDYDENILDENVSQQIKTLKTIMAPMKGKKISVHGAQKLIKIMDI